MKLTENSFHANIPSLHNNSGTMQRKFSITRKEGGIFVSAVSDI